MSEQALFWDAGPLRPTQIKRQATISACGLYRYRLVRSWSSDRPMLPFVMLNPSTADADKDDPTIRRCSAFAKAWGYGGLVVVNLFAYRATSPKDLKSAGFPTGDPVAMEFIRGELDHASIVVVAWGSHGAQHPKRIKEILAFCKQPMCFGVTKTLDPKHPLYIKGSTSLVPYRVRYD